MIYDNKFYEKFTKFEFETPVKELEEKITASIGKPVLLLCDMDGETVSVEQGTLLGFGINPKTIKMKIFSFDWRNGSESYEGLIINGFTCYMVVMRSFMCQKMYDNLRDNIKKDFKEKYQKKC